MKELHTSSSTEDGAGDALVLPTMINFKDFYSRSLQVYRKRMPHFVQGLGRVGDTPQRDQNKFRRRRQSAVSVFFGPSQARRQELPRSKQTPPTPRAHAEGPAHRKTGRYAELKKMTSWLSPSTSDHHQRDGESTRPLEQQLHHTRYKQERLPQKPLNHMARIKIVQQSPTTRKHKKPQTTSNTGTSIRRKRRRPHHPPTAISCIRTSPRKQQPTYSNKG